MEKFIKKINRKRLFCLLTFFTFFCSNAQSPSFVEKIRFPMWAEVDAYPGLEIKQDGKEYEYPISRLKETIPFLVNGMVYGWEFTYVPYDKTRGVEEFFEIREIQDRKLVNEKIKYSEPWIEENKFNCWIDFERDEFQIQNYKLWASIKNPSIQGRGYGKLQNGFDGIQEACEDAVKNAIREYYRSKYKNKPKEITGSVLIRKEPILGIDKGRYVINLDFFLECGKIKSYVQF